MTADAPITRALFPYVLPIQTRWNDNDQYGHVNNVVFYSYFDTVVNQHLAARAGVRFEDATVIGVVVETSCKFKKPLSYPDVIDAGLRVLHLSSRAVRYQIGIFGPGDDEPSAVGEFVHVYVARDGFKPVPIPDRIRTELEKLAA